MSFFEENRGNFRKVELDRKLLRSHSPFIPYSIRIEILEYTEVNFEELNLNLFNSFGYFKTDETRNIYQVFRCFGEYVVEDGADCNMIPSVSTICGDFVIFDCDGFWKRKLSKFQNLKTVSFRCFSGIGGNIFNAISRIPKLTNLCLIEENETYGLVGLEKIIENSRLMRISIQSFFGGEKLPIFDYFQRKLYMIRGKVAIHGFKIEVNYSTPCEILNERIDLSHCSIGNSFFQFFGNNNEKEYIEMHIRKTEISPLDAMFDEKTILSIIKSDRCLVFYSECYFFNSRNEKEQIHSCYFGIFRRLFSGVHPSGLTRYILGFGSGEENIFPDEMIRLLNSLQRIQCIFFNKEIESSELLKIKNSTLEYINLLGINQKKLDEEEIKKLKENNPQLTLLIYGDDRSNWRNLVE